MTEVELDISPPGLRGLNRLAIKLNQLRASEQLSDWHLGRWSDKAKTRHGIIFDVDDDAASAKVRFQHAR
jgi:hypothetical protein